MLFGFGILLGIFMGLLAKFIDVLTKTVIGLIALFTIFFIINLAFLKFNVVLALCTSLGEVLGISAVTRYGFKSKTVVERKGSYL